jgi:predicted dithiol-disulfide oxidoreductase (DUF899 family)/predicted enzyme related to lactoylglutathione lyase
MERSILLNQIEQLEREIYEKKKQLSRLRLSVPEQLVRNYKFELTGDEKVSLLDLFGDKNELFVVHNMGKSCSYCTMWADGFNGIYHHLNDQASFVVASPDAPEVQENFAAERKWRFPMISVRKSSFTEDLGFQKGKSMLPGVSTFRKDDQGLIYLHAQAPFGPGDDYCVTWSLFNLLPSGAKDVQVKKKIHTNSEFQLTNNVAVGVTNYQEAIKFYQTIFGMKVEKTFENETLLSMSGTNFFIEKGESNPVFFEFAVEEVESAKRILLENGCKITKEYNEKSLMITDPFGMRFHLFESD